MHLSLIVAQPPIYLLENFSYVLNLLHCVAKSYTTQPSTIVTVVVRFYYFWHSHYGVNLPSKKGFNFLALPLCAVLWENFKTLKIMNFYSTKGTSFCNKQNGLHFICPQLFHSHDKLTKRVQNVVHLHARTLSVAVSLLVDGRVNNVLLQTVPDISEALLL